MAVAFKAAGPVAGIFMPPLSSTGAFTQYPASVAPGDVLVLFVSAQASAQIVAPAGWTEFGPNTATPQQGFFVQYRAFWRRATGGEGGTTVAVSMGNGTGGNNQGYAVIASFTGVVLNGVPIAHSVANNGTLTLDTSIGRFAIAMLQAAFVPGNNTNWTAESWPGLTGVVGTEQYDGGTGLLIYTATATGGTASSFTASSNGSQLGGVLFDLVPASAPFAPTLSTPTSGSTIDRGVVQRFSWTFSAPDPFDTQAQFELHYRVSGGTTWTVVGSATPNNYADLAPNTFADGITYEWQARVAGQVGTLGPWSTSSFFTAATTPSGPTITAPTNNATIGLPTQTVTWSAPNQAAYQVRRVADVSGSADTVTVYSDSGQITDSVTRGYALNFATNNRAEHIQVRVLFNTLWSPWSDVRVVVSYTAPATPTLALTTNSATASIKLTPTQPTPAGSQPAVTTIDVYRSKDGAVFQRIAKSLLPSAAFYDYTPASGASYSYFVRAYGANGTLSDSATVSSPTTVITGGTYGSGYIGGY